LLVPPAALEELYLVLDMMSLALGPDAAAAPEAAGPDAAAAPEAAGPEADGGPFLLLQVALL